MTVGYVLVRLNGDGDEMFVTTSGDERSYRSSLFSARIFESRAAAKKECCVENECVRRLVVEGERLMLIL